MCGAATTPMTDDQLAASGLSSDGLRIFAEAHRKWAAGEPMAKADGPAAVDLFYDPVTMTWSTECPNAPETPGKRGQGA